MLSLSNDSPKVVVSGLVTSTRPKAGSESSHPSRDLAHSSGSATLMLELSFSETKLYDASTPGPVVGLFSCSLSMLIPVSTVVAQLILVFELAVTPLIDKRMLDADSPAPESDSSSLSVLLLMAERRTVTVSGSSDSTSESNVKLKQLRLMEDTLILGCFSINLDLVTGDSNKVFLIAVLSLEGERVSVDTKDEVERMTLTVEIEGEEVDEQVVVDQSPSEKHGESGRGELML